MASSSTQPAPLTSSSTDPREYEVFLSFRGADTRGGFADALYHAMKNIGIIVFRDREDLEVGEEINPGLAAAIKESQYAVVVISEHYAESKACLFELTAIMKCKRMGRLTVFPIFYHVSPSEVGKLMKDVENIFTKPKGNPEAAKAKWETWKSLLGKLGDYSVDPELDNDLPESCRRALKEASDLSAMVVGKDSYETEVAREFSLKIFSGLVVNSPVILEDLVGIKSRVIEIMELLNPRVPDRVCVVGICGMKGMGKSILAEVIYSKVSPQFEGRCILYQIGKKTSHDDLVVLQKKLISNILGKEAEKALGNDDHKVKNALQTRLQKKKVFIVLDDVVDDIQINYLAESLKWFGYGSKIIITSQKQNLLHLCQKNVYVVEPLNEKDALQLFCLKAFKQCEPKEGFEKLAAEISSCAAGLPFALNSSGTLLSRKDRRDAWEAYLEELRGNNPIDKTLDKSLNELDDKHRELFLDIICFQPGLFLDIGCFLNRPMVNSLVDGKFVQMLKALGYNPIHDLEVLKDKSLIRISEERELLVHDFLIAFGSKKAKSNRLFEKNDIVDKLKSSTAPLGENPDVISIHLNQFIPEVLSLEALSTMINLRALMILSHTITWCGDLTKLSKELRIIEWKQYPLNSLPDDLNFGIKLVTLKLCGGKIKTLWVGKKSLPELKYLDLEYLEELIAIPDLSGSPKLEILRILQCKTLSTLPPSIGNLKFLKELLIQECEDLQELPNEIISTFLQYLSLEGCSRVKQCPNIQYSLQCLQKLDISGTSIEGLPFSSKKLPSLEYFRAIPTHLVELPSFFFSSEKLIKLQISGFKSGFSPNFRFPASFPALGSLGMLKTLCLSNLNMLDEARLSTLSGLSSLLSLTLSNSNFTNPLVGNQVPNLKRHVLSGCENVKKLSEAELSNCLNLRSLEILDLSHCNLEAIPKSIDLYSLLSILDLRNNHFTKLPDSISKLSKLKILDLRGCIFLESLPKLPLSLEGLLLSHCPELGGGGESDAHSFCRGCIYWLR